MAADKKRLGATAPGLRKRRGEFELRQRQLPADRRAKDAYGRALTKARDEVNKTPLGAPPKCVDVRSVYDVRPINAFDFNISASVATQDEDTQAIVSFQVPEGFVCVLRNFDLWMEPDGTGLFRSNFLWSLQLNGGDFPYNINVPFGQSVDRETVFMIADEFNTVGLRVTTAGGTFPDAGNLFARFYGNFLLKDGSPAPLQIGNPTQNCAPIRTQPGANTFRAPPPQPQMPVTRTSQPQAFVPADDSPPFEVRWTRPMVAHGAGSSRSKVTPPATPVYANGQPLSPTDQQKYAAYLNRTRPK